MGSTRDKFASLGFDGKDKRHIGVYVMPAAEVTNGELTQTHKIHIGNGTGDMRVSYPTELIFASMIEPWVFERFTLAGRDWDGIAVLPDDGDFEVSFGDPTRQSVVITDTPSHFFTHRYQLVMRNTDTGEIVTTDPGVANDDDQGSIP